jgi:hypothetical protein
MAASMAPVFSFSFPFEGYWAWILLPWGSVLSWAQKGGGRGVHEFEEVEEG